MPNNQSSLAASSETSVTVNASAGAALVDDKVQRQGWTSQPNGRGTLDIIWSCAFTMFLCSWSILCLNVPGPDDTAFKVLRRKVYLTTLALLGPEFIFQIALAQWESARRSVRDFHASGYTQWTMTHAFYADMGGFVLQTRDWTPFPIDAKQLHYLVTEGYIDLPKLDKRVIVDKNKVDGMLRFITLCQIFWFLVNITGRAVQHLAITTGELTTAAFIVCSFGTTYCWVHKPADITTPDVIETDVSIAQILIRAGDRAKKPYSRTPLDFVSRKEWQWSLYWSNWINILRNMGIVFGPRVRPVNRFENTIIPEPSRAGYWVSLLVTLIYASIFICGWNYSFPTRAEKILWRAASVGVMGCLFAYCAISEFAFSVYPSIQQRFFPAMGKQDEEGQPRSRRQRIAQEKSRLKRIAMTVADCCRNNSLEQDPDLTVPLKAILPMYVVGFIYCHCRTYILFEDILELRSLPASAYMTVNWTNILPHL
ncbi:hypothetical protein VTN96DRAFT_6053 [Rasamsonia emersonii]